MTDLPHHGQPVIPVQADLVEYLIVAVADLDGLGTVGDALERLVDDRTVRILDLVALVRHADGEVEVWEPEAVPGLTDLVALGPRRDLLSARDVERASTALPPGSAGVVVVTEDRWAEPLSTAARLAGGRIVAGDRIPAAHVEAVLSHRPDEPEGP